MVSIPQQLDAESSANLRDIEQALLGATVSVPVFFTQESPELQAAVSGQAGGWACHLTADVTSCSQHLCLCLRMGPCPGRAQACIPRLCCTPYTQVHAGMPACLAWSASCPCCHGLYATKQQAVPSHDSATGEHTSSCMADAGLAIHT